MSGALEVRMSEEKIITSIDIENQKTSLESSSQESSNDFSEDSKKLRILEALFFASNEPLNINALSGQLKIQPAEIFKLIDTLKTKYQSSGINLNEIAGGWAFRTAPDLASELTIYRNVKRRLSKAALETLAIIAYHQPITRAEIEDIRGVMLSRGTLDQLLEIGWVKPRGKRRTPGRPATWVTTNDFLSHFGLAALDDLPAREELKGAGLLDLQIPLNKDEKINPDNVSINYQDTSESMLDEEANS